VQLAVAALAEGDAPTANRLLEDSLALQREIGEVPGRRGCAVGLLGVAALVNGDRARAAGLAAESAGLWRRLDAQARTAYEQGWLPYALEIAAAAAPDAVQAGRLCGAAAALRGRGAGRNDRSPTVPPAIWAPLRDRWLAPSRARLGPAAYAAAAAAGHALTPEQAVAEALEVATSRAPEEPGPGSAGAAPPRADGPPAGAAPVTPPAGAG